MAPDRRVFECGDFTKQHVEKRLIGEKVIVPCMKHAENDTLFTVEAIEIKFSRDVFGVGLHLLARKVV